MRTVSTPYVYLDAIAEALVGDRELTWKMLDDMKLGEKFLTKTFEMIKPQLAELTGYLPLREQDAAGYTRDQWSELIADTGYSEELCLRLASHSSYDTWTKRDVEHPILGTMPISSGPCYTVEIFVTKAGQLIVYRWPHSGRDIRNGLAICNTIEDLCLVLDNIVGLDSYFVPSPYTFTIADKLMNLVRKTNEAERERLQVRENLVEEWDAIHSRITSLL